MHPKSKLMPGMPKGILLIKSNCISTNVCINSIFYFIAMIPPMDFTTIKYITAPYSAEISWVTPYVILDKETYSVQYSTDMSLQNSEEVVVENNDELATNQQFSVNITGLTPFTTYYYIIYASNSVGNTSTDIMNFTTNQTGMSIIHGNT